MAARMAFLVFASATLAMMCCEAANQPHIILIVADDLGFDDVGFRSHQIRTPTIDRLAAEGVVLDQYIVQTVCSPSRAALMSGRLPLHTSVDAWIPMPSAYGLPLNETTLATRLKGLNYTTHAVGKWHLGFYKWPFTPTFRGFDSFYGFYGGGEDYFTHSSSGAYDFRDDVRPNCGAGCSRVASEAYGQYTTELFGRRAEAVIAAHDASTPLFLYLPFQAVHSPGQVPKPYSDAYNKTIADKTRRTFAGMLTCMDEAIGNVTAALQKRGMLQNSIIVFTTDNGGPVVGGDSIGASNWPLRGGKHSIWDGGVRGTALVWSQRYLPQRGGTYGGLMHIVDWFPTLVEAAGGKSSDTIDGVSQWQALLSSGPSPRQAVYVGLDQALLHRAWRTHDWKILVAPVRTPAGGDPSDRFPPANATPPAHTVALSSESSWLSSSRVETDEPFATLSRRARAIVRLRQKPATANNAAALPLASSAAAPAQCVTKQGACYPGDDIRQVTSDSVGNCCNVCQATSGCVGFTYRLDTQQCYIKKYLTTDPILDITCVSGFALTPGTIHLYKVSSDPTESSDVAQQYPNMTSTLLAALMAAEQTGTHTAVDDPSCGSIVHPVDPVVGVVWAPWC